MNDPKWCENHFKEVAQSFFAASGGEDACHDLLHTERVLSNVERLSAFYPEADKRVLHIAACLHDIGRTRSNGMPHAVNSARMAEEILSSFPEKGLTEAQYDNIIVCIEEHSWSGGRKPSSLESAILQDGDRLDALGAVGIARVIAFDRSGTLYCREDPFGERGRLLDDRLYTVDHFFLKILKIKDSMNTEPAKCTAEKRSRFIRDFLKNLKEELSGG